MLLYPSPQDLRLQWDPNHGFDSLQMPRSQFICLYIQKKCENWISYLCGNNMPFSGIKISLKTNFWVPQCCHRMYRTELYHIQPLGSSRYEANSGLQENKKNVAGQHIINLLLEVHNQLYREHAYILYQLCVCMCVIFYSIQYYCLSFLASDTTNTGLLQVSMKRYSKSTETKCSCKGGENVFFFVTVGANSEYVCSKRHYI